MGTVSAAFRRFPSPLVRNQTATPVCDVQPVRLTVAALAALAMTGLVACAGGGSSHEAPWTLVQAKPDSSVAVVLYFHGSCDTLQSVHTILSATTVTFKIVVHEDAQVCDAAGRGTAIRIRLGDKLGDRKIVGPCHPGPGVLCAPPATQPSFYGHDLPIYGP
jgi:hypothetical protein